MAKRILITGISGFIAGHLARTLAGEGVPLIGVGRSRPKALPDGVEFRHLDITDAAKTREVIAHARPDVVYHLASNAVLQGAADGPLSMLETNVRGTWNVLEAARLADVPAVIVVSSDKQYGTLAVPPYDDEDTTAFLNGGLYELSKAQQDQIGRLYAGLYDTPAVRVARLANIYGPGDTHWTRIVPGTIRRTIVGERPRIVAGAGQALREYAFVDDAVAALRTLAADALSRGNAPLRRPDGKLARVGFNVGSEHRFDAAGVITRVQRVMAEEFGVVGAEPEIVPGTPGVFEPGSQFSKLGRIREVMPGYAPRSFEDGLCGTIPWYRDHIRAMGT